MGRIIRFDPDRHEETRILLPWYLTGQLEADERARLEAHLRDCAECQAELRLEQRLAQAVAELPVDVDQGWSALAERLQPEPETVPPPARAGRAAGQGGWAIAAQFLVAAGLIGALALPFTVPARYHALGAARPAPAAGDLIVIFQPEAEAQDLTRALRDTGARLVDGPTAADAYVLDVPMSRRAEALRRLRADAAVALAEPIDPAGRP